MATTRTAPVPESKHFQCPKCGSRQVTVQPVASPLSTVLGFLAALAAFGLTASMWHWSFAVRTLVAAMVGAVVKGVFSGRNRVVCAKCRHEETTTQVSAWVPRASASADADGQGGRGAPAAAGDPMDTPAEGTPASTLDPGPSRTRE